MESGVDNSLSSVTLVPSGHHIYSKRKRKFVVFLVLGVVLCIAVVAGLLLTSKKQRQEQLLPNPDPSPLVSFVSFENAMNRSVDPCQDFYSFACGNWVNPRPSIDTTVPFIIPFTVLQDEVNEKVRELFKQLTIKDDFPQILNNAILFYKSCIDGVEKKIDYSPALKDVFKGIGGWPLLLGDKWNETAFDWSLASVHLKKMLDIESGFDIRVSTDFTNSTRNLLLIKPPALDQELLNDQVMIFYCVVNGINPSLTEQYVKHELMNTIAFEQRIRGMISAFNMLNNTKMKILDLQEEIPAVNWLFILQALTNDTLCPSQCLTADDDVIINDITTLKRIITFIENWNGSKRDIANYFGWLVVADIYPIIPGVFKMYGQYFGYQSNELYSLVEEKCYKAVKDTFTYALDYIFIKNFSYFDMKDSAKLVSYSKKAFRKLITAADWLDNETKWTALRKLDHMHDVVGYPKFYSSKELLDKICKKFPVMGIDVIQNYVESTKFFINTGLYRLKLSNNFENYILPRVIRHVSAYYDLYRNIIAFPLSIQFPPFFYDTGPWYLNFGAIGAVIGHEINHGFDDNGHKYDIAGNLANWWTNKSIEEFNDRLTCFKEQYNEYEFEFNGKVMTVNGTRTVGENMADSSGLRQAYIAYKLREKEVDNDNLYPSLAQYTPDQMFFISFASLWCSEPNPGISSDYFQFSPHSPPRLRVIGSVSNSEDFAKAFNCPVGSPMNPTKKCVFW